MRATSNTGELSAFDTEAAKVARPSHLSPLQPRLGQRLLRQALRYPLNPTSDEQAHNCPHDPRPSRPGKM